MALVGLFLPEPVEVFLGQAPFQERPGVHAGGGVALEEDLVPAACMVPAAEEVVEANLVQRRGTGIGGDVSANADVRALGAVHQNRCVPAQPGPVLALDFFLAGELRLLVGRNGVHVIGGRDHGHADTLRASPLEQATHNELGTLRATLLNQCIQRLKPFGSLLWITIRQLVCQPAEDGGIVL